MKRREAKNLAPFVYCTAAIARGFIINTNESSSSGFGEITGILASMFWHRWIAPSNDSLGQFESKRRISISHL